MALYRSAVRPGVNTRKAEDLRSEIDQQLAAQQQQQAAQQFQQALQQFRANPSDSARQQIIKLAQAMKTSAAIPEEARGHYVMAQAFMEKATVSSGFASAIQEYKAAVLAAPWWADACKKLAIAQKAAEQYDNAIASLNLYLTASPADARDAQDEIYKLKADKQAAVEQKAADERKQQEEQQRQREAQQRVAEESKARDVNDWFRRFDGARYTRSFVDDDGVTITYALQIQGRTLVETTNAFKYNHWGEFDKYTITEPGLAGGRGCQNTPDNSFRISEGSITTLECGETYVYKRER